MATQIARGHDGDGGDRPPHGDPRRLPTEYFDLQILRNTDRWEDIRLGIHAECQRAYKDNKQEFKIVFDKLEAMRIL
ncbi:hypothetical protein R6Q59_036712 [Mikania micrantha]